MKLRSSSVERKAASFHQGTGVDDLTKLGNTVLDISDFLACIAVRLNRPEIIDPNLCFSGDTGLDDLEKFQAIAVLDELVGSSGTVTAEIFEDINSGRSLYLHYLYVMSHPMDASDLDVAANG